MVFMSLGLFGACDHARQDDASSDSVRPLQPLVYTERPSRTPEAAEVRERRLLRELLYGAEHKGRWGPLKAESSDDLPELVSSERLGRALFEGLLGDDSLWDHIFVSSTDYARLVRVDLEAARDFVNRKQADALEARRAFEIERASEQPRGGLNRLFTFESLDLGRGRTLDGAFADDEERVAQHWDNTLTIGLAEGDATFEIRIPKILRLPRSGPHRSPLLRIASDIHLESRFYAFLQAGLHLKPKLLQGAEYPIPLEVGNYWRYRRHVFDDQDQRLTTVTLAEPDRTTIKVTSVDRYGTRRLVELRFSYNAPDWSNHHEHWLLTPRRMYLCSRPCRRHVDDLDWLLSYLDRTEPITQLPLERGSSWGGTSTSDGTPTFRVAEAWHHVETPSGRFFGALALEGVGPLATRGARLKVQQLTRQLVPGKGIVRRTYRGTYRRDSYRVVESLIDYRILPK